jgi:Protein of unknown function (DUF3141)
LDASHAWLPPSLRRDDADVRCREGAVEAELDLGDASDRREALVILRAVDAESTNIVCRAEAVFIEEVASRHPEADGKPTVIANCQAAARSR